MAEALLRIPLPIMIGVICLVAVVAILAIVKKAIKLGIFMLVLSIVLSLGIPFINKLKEETLVEDITEGVEHLKEYKDFLEYDEKLTP